MTNATIQNHINPFAEKRALKHRETMVWVNIFCLSVMVIVSFLYITKTSELSTRGYSIAELENEKTTLTRETQKLEVQIAQERSLDRVLERMGNMGMVPLDNIAYVTPTPNSLVALR